MTAEPLTQVTPAAPGSVSVCARFPWLMAGVRTAAVVSGNWPLTTDPAPPGWTCFPRVATRTAGAEARAVGRARDFAIATVRRWGAVHRSGDVAVVVSEMLTNALRHAAPDPGHRWPGPPVQLGLMNPGPCVLCMVVDPSPRSPAPQDPGPLAESGRGLHVIEALSDNWGYTLLGHGKVVWAMFSTVP